MRGNLGRAPPELTFFDMRAVVLMSSVFDLVRYSEFPDGLVLGAWTLERLHCDTRREIQTGGLPLPLSRVSGSVLRKQVEA